MKQKKDDPKKTLHELKHSAWRTCINYLVDEIQESEKTDKKKSASEYIQDKLYNRKHSIDTKIDLEKSKGKSDLLRTMVDKVFPDSSGIFNLGPNLAPLWSALEGKEDAGLALLWLAKITGGSPEKIREASNDDLYWLIDQNPFFCIHVLAALISVFQQERHLAKVEIMSSSYYRLVKILENEIVTSTLEFYDLTPDDIIDALNIFPVTFYGGPSKGPEPLLSNIKNKAYPKGVPVGQLL